MIFLKNMKNLNYYFAGLFKPMDLMKKIYHILYFIFNFKNLIHNNNKNNKIKLVDLRTPNIINRVLNQSKNSHLMKNFLFINLII